MGLLSILGRIGKGALGIATGGVSSALGDVLGGASKSGQAQNNNQDTIKLALQNAQLNRDKYALAAPGVRMNTSIRAAMAKRGTPSSVQWGGPGSGLRGEIPQFSGGRKSVYAGLQEPDTQGLLDRVIHEQLMGQVAGGPSGGNADAAMPTNIGQSSTFDKILGGGAFGSSILGAILKARGNGNSTPSAVPFGEDDRLG